MAESEANARVIRCLYCGLNQFHTQSGACRRCLRAYVEALPDPVVMLPAEEAAPEAIKPRKPHTKKIVPMLGEALRRARAMRNLSQEGLARKLQKVRAGRAGYERTVPRSYITKLETYIKNPKLETVRDLAEALNITVAELLPEAENVRRAREKQIFEDKFVGLIAKYVHGLTPEDRQTIQNAAAALAKGQLPFGDWMKV
jgi:transcriptional regulator with XRE-family HTH domain